MEPDLPHVEQTAMAKKAQDTHSEEPQIPHAPEPRRNDPPRTPEATLLVLMGFGTTLAGLALSMGPKFSWKVDQISQGFDYLGIHGGTMIMGGLILAALGMIRRGLSLHLANDGRDVDYELSMNQIAVDLGDVRAALLEFDERFRGMKGAMKMISAQIAETGKREDSDGKSEDAIFRMAASIDQTSARMDKRMSELFEGLRQNLSGAGSEFDQTRMALQAVSSDVQAASQRIESALSEAMELMTAPASNSREQAPAPVAQAAAPVAQAAPPAQPPQQAPAPVAEAPRRESSLGVLDDMDDYDAPMPVDSYSQAEAPEDSEPVEVHFDEQPAQGQRRPEPPVNMTDEAVDEALRAMRRHAEG